MESAFGIDHGEIEKGIGDAFGRGVLQAKGAKQGFKLARTHGKLARAEAGYRPGLKGFGDSVKAGRLGTAKPFKRGLKQANQVARQRTMSDVNVLNSGRRVPAGNNPHTDSSIANARFNRRMSRV